MQSEQQRILWNRIQQFAIDDPQASVKYSDKLGHHNGWSKEYAGRVIEEYKKFIFLCCVLPQGASPSKPVDEAWHLHLTYTHNYWKEFCNDILGKEIHHYPSKGGPEEKEKHLYWYNTTLEAYRKFFGEEAPPDIWIRDTTLPDKTVWAGNMLNNYRVWYKRYLYILTLPFLLIIILYARINPYNLTGPQFLLFYSCLIISTVTYLLLIRSKKITEIEGFVAELYKRDADIYQVARFIYGKECSLRAAVVDLAERKVLEPVRRSKFIYYPSNYRYSSSEKNPLAVGLVRNLKDGETISFNSFYSYYDDASTYHHGLSNLYRATNGSDYLPVIIGIMTLVAGIARIIQGYQNDKPVIYLSVMCVISFFILMVAVIVSSGQNILQQLFKDNFRSEGKTAYPSSALAGAFVFLGLGSLSRMDGYLNLNNTFSKQRSNNDSGSWGGCGSSGCGSDGGGSCGGGGCGGCGGGD
jgi:hypothetical protein